MGKKKKVDELRAWFKTNKKASRPQRGNGKGVGGIPAQGLLVLDEYSREEKGEWQEENRKRNRKRRKLSYRDIDNANKIRQADTPAVHRLTKKKRKKKQ